MNLSKTFRFYILGDVINFMNSNHIFHAIKNTINASDRFFYLILICVFLSILAGVIVIINKNRILKTYLLYVIGGILIYSAYCFQKSFEIQLKSMDAKSKHAPLFNNWRTKNESLISNLSKKLQNTFLHKLFKIENNLDEYSKEKEELSTNSSDVELVLTEKDKDSKNESIPETENQEMSEKEKYLSRIRKNIEFEKKTDEELLKYVGYLEKVKNDIVLNWNIFEGNFNKVSKNSKLINKDLLKADISIDIYSLELNELKSEIIKEFSLLYSREQQIPLQKVVEEIPNPSENKLNVATDPTFIVENALQKLSNSVNNSIKNFNNLEKEEYDIKVILKSMWSNLNILQVILIIQTVLSVFIFMAVVLDWIFFIQILKISLLILLILNIFEGLTMMIYVEEVDKSCSEKTTESCKMPINVKVDQIITLLDPKMNSIRGDSKNQVKFIQGELEKLEDHSSKQMENLEEYIYNTWSNKSINKIFVFESLINKLYFLKDGLENLDNENFDNDEYFKEIKKMKESLERIKHDIYSIDKKEILSLYKDMAKSQFFFNNEKEEVLGNVELFLNSETKNIEKENIKKCKREIKHICLIRQKGDDLYLILLTFGVLFTILLSL